MANNFCKEFNEVNKSNRVIKKISDEIRIDYPISLKVKDIIELTGYSQATVYRMLENKEIPGAKKIRGWRIPRDIFLSWWYSEGTNENSF